MVLALLKANVIACGRKASLVPSVNSPRLQTHNSDAVDSHWKFRLINSF